MILIVIGLFIVQEMVKDNKKLLSKKEENTWYSRLAAVLETYKTPEQISVAQEIKQLFVCDKLKTWNGVCSNKSTLSQRSRQRS